MRDKTFQVNLYSVEVENLADNPTTEFNQAILNAAGQTLATREKDIRGRVRRLNDFCAEANNTLLFLNFVTASYSGMGRVRSGQPVMNIRLAPDENFAPETAILYDVTNNLALVESSQSMGTGAISDYFESFANAGVHYTLAIRLDEDASARARNYQSIRAVTLGATGGPVTDRDRDAGLGLMKGIVADLEGAKIVVTVTSERQKDRSLSIDAIRRIFNNLIGSPANERTVNQFIVKGREHDDDPLEVIDLFQQRQKREVKLEIDAYSRKVPLSARWDALRQFQQAYVN